MGIYINKVSTYLPQNEVTNQLLEEYFKIPSDWIISVTGNESRYYGFDFKESDIKETCLDLAYQASKKILEDDTVIDAIVLATSTPDNLIPSTVNLLADKLEKSSIRTYQIQSGCAGAVQALDLARLLIKSGEVSNSVLVVGVDTVGKFIDLSKKLTDMKASEVVNYALFGDGCGAALVSTKQEGLEVCKIINRFSGLGVEGAQKINWFGHIPTNLENFSKKEINNKFINVEEDYTLIKEKVPVIANKILKELCADENIDFLLPPQLNKHMTDSIIESLPNISDKIINVVAEVGNSGNALPFYQLEKLFTEYSRDSVAVLIAVESSKWIETGLLLKGV
ncbi:3-oxoacyl-ACP synthase III family protein [Streptococcus mutans]|uniref:3-oxoacyl-ACP synthase III family protein n=1 Tax=Streptococcus mutans TaxID=1309 RepID=UPI0002B54768|nr:3-oxoacyl-ACP synthase III family protein [Streptococcus mutans]EMB77233.1 3-oxoacyl-[acyl-carrier-protein] synthase III [Streptococcus mutans 5SM3]EMB84805.1 3-oxoacyl-[acyl-carrier-protein] synthase III [Streptococcus mutans N29]EMB88352.1 3-oxoacyl-[acyl-carrier-protein] synthase III [Streptococcus mutans NMT4863]MCB4979140.1 3-oxoacyl-ACP synthase III family protein [Streptococcus mutans]MCB5052362.1 3-oxoacyl-ACP synthase III family protein [Streptococcus mutans]